MRSGKTRCDFGNCSEINIYIIYIFFKKLVPVFGRAALICSAVQPPFDINFPGHWATLGN